MSWIKNYKCRLPLLEYGSGVFNPIRTLSHFDPRGFQLDIPQLELLDRGVNVLTGSSGSGKTTFAHSLCGLPPTRTHFQWWFKGKNLALLSPPNRRISLLFQTLELFPHLCSEQNILFPMEVQLKKSLFQWVRDSVSLFSQKKSSSLLKFSSKVQNRFNLLREHLFLDSFLKKPVGLLSGGEKQRVAIARALIGSPRFLILDEPFSYLDLNLRQSVVLLLKKIIDREDLPVLLITHNVKWIKSLVSRLFVMKNGTVLQDSK